MPTVPIDNNQFSLNVPNASQAPRTMEFGKLGSAIEGAGNQIENTSDQIGEQMLKSDAVNKSANAFASDQMWLAQRKTQLLTGSPDGMMHDPDGSVSTDPNTNNPVTIADQLHSDLNERYMANQDSMNNITKQMYRQSALPHFSNEIAKFTTTAQQQQVSYQNTVMKQGAEAAAGLTENTPYLSLSGNTSVKRDANGNLLSIGPKIDPATNRYEVGDITAQNFYSAVRPRLLQIQQGVGSTYNQTTANSQALEIQQKMSGIAADNMLTSLSTAPHPNDPSKYDQGLAFKQLLQGEDPESIRLKAAGLPIFSDMMDPIEKDAKIRAINNAMPALRASDDSNTRFILGSAQKQAERGNLSQSDYLKMQDLNVAMLRDSPEKSNEIVSNSMNLAAAMFNGKQDSASMSMMTSAQRNAMNNSIKPQILAEGSRVANEGGVQIDPILAATANNTIDNYFLQQEKQIQDGQSKDLAKYFMQPRADNNGKAYLASGDKMYNIDGSRVLALGSPEFQKNWSEHERSYESVIKGAVSDNPDNYRMGIPAKGAPFSTEAIGSALTDISKKSALNESQKAQGMQELQKGFGKDFPALIDQMIQDKSIPATWKVWEGRDLSDQNANTFLMSSLLGGNREDHDYEKTLKDEGIKKEDVMKSVEKVTKGDTLAQALSDPLSNYGENTMKDFQNVIYNGTLKLMNQGYDRDKAAQLSHDMILGKDSTLPIGKSVITLPQMIDGHPVGDATKDVMASNGQSILDGVAKLPLWNPVHNRPMTDQEKQGIIPNLKITDADDKSKVQLTYTDQTGVKQQLTTVGHNGKEADLLWSKSDLAKPASGQSAPVRLPPLKSFEQYLMQKFYTPAPTPSVMPSPQNGPIPGTPPEAAQPLLNAMTKAKEKAAIAAPSKTDSNGVPDDRNFTNSPDYKQGVSNYPKMQRPPADLLNEGMHGLVDRSPQSTVGKDHMDGLSHFAFNVVLNRPDGSETKFTATDDQSNLAARLRGALMNGGALPKDLTPAQLKRIKDFKDATGAK